jgi:hypothetical protein
VGVVPAGRVIRSTYRVIQDYKINIGVDIENRPWHNSFGAHHIFIEHETAYRSHDQGHYSAGAHPRRLFVSMWSNNQRS